MYYLVMITTVACFGFNCPEEPEVKAEIISAFETKRECQKHLGKLYQSQACLSEKNFENFNKKH